MIDKNKAIAHPIVPVDLSVPYGSLIVSKDTNKRLGESNYRSEVFPHADSVSGDTDLMRICDSRQNPGSGAANPLCLPTLAAGHICIINHALCE